ncbi:Retrovirus-related Pol polyprotein from transposon gypsy, partial [Mucuna pruriens]
MVVGASSYKMLYFLDAYSGYNQIRMYPPDEDKTTFMMEGANFCYCVIPFKLKNAGVTYKRLMDKSFKQQVGHNMEVYVDDMVVKSTNINHHFRDLSRVFNEIQCYNIIKGGKFLRFMLMDQGIEVNLEKCEAIMNMRSPQTIK